MKHDKHLTSELLHALSERFVKLMPVHLRKSQLVVDLVDIHEICRAYLGAIDRIVHQESSDIDQIESVLYEIDCQILEHLPYHLKSLKKLLPRAIAALDKKRETDSSR